MASALSFPLRRSDFNFLWRFDIAHGVKSGRDVAQYSLWIMGAELLDHIAIKRQSGVVWR